MVECRLRNGATREADHHDAPLKCDALGRSGVRVAAHRVEDDVGAVASGELLDRGHEVLGASIDDQICTEFLGVQRLFGSTHDTDDLRTRSLTQLHCRTADASCGRVHEQVVALGDLRPTVQREPCGLVADAQSGCLCVVECIGSVKDVGLIHQRVLGERAARQIRVSHDPLADDGTIDSLTDGDNLTTQFDAGREGQRRLDLVLALAQQDVGEVGRRGKHFHQNLAGTGGGCVDLFEGQDVAGITEFVDAPGFHGCISFYGLRMMLWDGRCRGPRLRHVGISLRGRSIRRGVGDASSRFRMRVDRPWPA